MDTKLLLIAASTIALAACGGSEVEEDTAQVEYEGDTYAETGAIDDDGELGAETLVEPEQPPLEGDSPFVDSQDVAQSRMDQENYDSGLDGPDLTDEDELFEDEAELASGDAVSGYGVNDTALMDDEIDVADDDIDVMTAEERMAAPTIAESDPQMSGQSDMQMAQSGNSTMQDESRMAGTQQGSNDPGIPAAQETVEETDAVLADGNIVTGSEAALLAGTYEVMIAGMDEPAMLVIDGRGNQATGTFADEPIEIAVTGRNFQFDAPVMMNGEEDLMTFTGTLDDGGMIDNGIVQAQGGDGASLDFTAERIDQDAKVGADDMANDW